MAILPKYFNDCTQRSAFMRKGEKKMRKFPAAVAAFIAAATLSASAAVFNQTQSYKSGQFADVKDESWYASSVESAYNLGFMNGTDGKNFSPDGNVTLAQAVTIAARVHAIYNGKTAPVNSTTGNWYDTYVKYATDNGILTDGEYSDFGANAQRSEVAHIFAKALPESYYNKINDVKKVPDVPSTNSYASELLMLYNAGVIMGNDEFGTFFPTSSIKRSEISAIISRAAIPENRLKKTLVNADYEDAYYLIDDCTGVAATSGTNVKGTAWNYDNRARFLSVSNMLTTFNDVSDKFPIVIWRDINDQTEGLLTLKLNTSATFASQIPNGVYYSITDDNKNELMKLEFIDGEIALCGKKTGFEYKSGQVGIRVDMDLDKRTARLFINGIDYGDGYTLTDVAAGRFYAGTTAEAKNVSFAISKIEIFRNYLVNEKFDVNGNTNIPENWETSGNASIATTGGQGYNDSYSLVFKADKKSSHSAKKTFNAISGNIVFETYVFLPTDGTRATVSLNGADKQIASMRLEGGKIYSGTGKELRFHNGDIWQCLRIEANTTTGNVIYKINGKKCGEEQIAGMPKTADNITYNFDADKAAQIAIDDAEVYLTHEYDDYCPKPVPALSDKYDVVLNICSLWRQGQHWGWEAVSAYPDKETYLGFYDEGLTEVADWEIKYMVEHGISVQHLCWYCPSNDINEPIKKSRMNDALHDGFFNAKYSDMMKFTFMWENSGQNCTNLEQFKKYIWNYWVDYYFTDPRFYTVDNKPVFTVWSYNQYKKAFGSVEGAMEARKFMEEDIKKYGFDGIIMLFADGHNQKADEFKVMKSLGADGSYAYHWQQDGVYADAAMKRMQKNEDFKALHIVPTASVGFNNIGWDTTRKPMASLAEHKKQLEYIKNTYLPSQSGEEDWHSRMLIISTWNEYGEGTYVMPAGVHGFGYLDNIREVLVGTPIPEGTDIKPTEQQKARLGHLYTGDMTTLTTLDNDNDEENVAIPEEKAYDLPLSAWKNGFGTESFNNDGSKITVKASANDHSIMTKPASEMLCSEIDAIHVQIQPASDTVLELFFTTTDSTSWAQNKSFNAKLTGGKVNDIYIKVADNALWNGTIAEFRLDPANTIMSSEITAIEFLKYSEDQKDYELSLDSLQYKPAEKIVAENGELYVPADPLQGFFSLHNLYYEWSRFTNRLYILSANGTEMEFHVGSDTVKVNGKDEKLAKPFVLKDGLPMLPYKWFLNKIGFTNYSVEGKSIKVSTIDAKYNDVINSRVENQWEFNVPGDFEGWSPSFMTSEITEDGIFFGTALERENQNPKYDAMLTMRNLKINAAKYPTATLRFRCDIEAESTTVVLYFATAADSSLSEAKSVRFTVTKEEGKEFKDYTLNFGDNQLWDGVVNLIRFDPLSGSGTCYIDYLRFNYDANSNITTAGSEYNAEKFEILNGDASNVKSKAFFSANANITIIPNPDKTSENIFDVKSKGGKQWAYFRQKVTYTPGATYKVSFDAKLTGTNDGKTDSSIASQILVNAVYLDADGKKDHVIKSFPTTVEGGWIHCECEYTVPANSTLRDSDEFSIYANPVGDLGANYQIKDVKVTEVKN